MAYVKDTDLFKNIRSGNIKNAYFFFGRDVASVKAVSDKLSSKLVSADFADYNLHKFEGKKLSISNLSDVSEQLPAFTDYICIMINDFNADNISSDENKQLIEIIDNIPETTVIIFNVTGFDLYGGKKALSAKNKKLLDAIAKKGEVCEFELKKPSELSKTIIEKFSKLGNNISKQNAEYIATLCLSDSVLINNEIQKLSSYKLNGEVTKADIDLLVCKQLDTNAFALARFVISNDIKNSMRILDELFSQRIEAVAILSAISMAFVDLYRAKVAIIEGVSQDKVIKDFNYKGRAFAVSNSFRDVSRIPVERLREYMILLAETDLKLKSTRTDTRILLEETITKMFVI